MATNFTEIGYDSVDVARAIRYSAQKQDLNVNMTQIHKLLYITYGTILVTRKARLTIEHPSAWPYGPVFPRVHKKVKLSDDITPREYDNINQENPTVCSLIDMIVSQFGRLSAGQLSEWSHQKDSPWDIAVHNSGGKWNTRIDDDDIYNYFFSALK